MRAFAIVIILALNWTVCSARYIQPSDSIPVDSTLTRVTPVWILNNMVFEVVKGRECTKLIHLMEVEIQKGLGVEVKLRDEITIQKKEISSITMEKNLAKAESNEWHGRYDNQVEITGHYKGQSNKLKWGLGFTILVIMGQLFFGG